MNETTIGTWTVCDATAEAHNGDLQSKAESAQIHDGALSIVTECDSGTADVEVPIAVVVELLRMNGYTVMPPAPAAGGAVCRYCEDYGYLQYDGLECGVCNGPGRALGKGSP